MDDPSQQYHFTVVHILKSSMTPPLLYIQKEVLSSLSHPILSSLNTSAAIIFVFPFFLAGYTGLWAHKLDSICTCGSLVKSSRKSTKNRKSKRRKDTSPELIVSKKYLMGPKELFIGHTNREPKMDQNCLCGWRPQLLPRHWLSSDMHAIWYGGTRREINE